MLGEDVYRQLETDILLGILKPRERLVEAELCNRLGVSKPLLREVFRRLEGVGLVAIHPNRGVVVQDFTLEDAQEICFVQRALERAACPLVIEKVTEEDMRDLRAINREFEDAAQTGDIPRMTFANLAFHRRYWRIPGNSFLYRVLELSHLRGIQIFSTAWLNAKTVQRSLAEHKELLAGLAERNLKKFQAAVESQIDGVSSAYQMVRGPHPNSIRPPAGLTGIELTT